MLYFIYSLVDPRYPNDIKYIGYTNNLTRRLYGHIYNAKRFIGNGNLKQNWIRMLLNNNIKPLIQQIDVASTIDDAKIKEIEYIEKYKSDGFNLKNGTIGGDGRSNIGPMSDEEKLKHSLAVSGSKNGMFNKTHTEISRKKISDAVSGKKHPFYGKNLTEQHRKNISEKLINRVFTDEWKNKLSIAASNRKVSDDTRKKMSESRIGEKNHFYGKTHTQKTLDKITASQEKNPDYFKSNRPVIQMDKKLNIIKEWQSIKVASLETNTNKVGIIKCCDGKQKTCENFIWRYK